MFQVLYMATLTAVAMFYPVVAVFLEGIKYFLISELL